MNHEKFIEEACFSILNQSYKNIEIIFLDNNSKDRTFEIADNIFINSGLPYIGIKNIENKGVAENLNLLISQANGEYISLLSGDDYYANDNITSKVDYLSKYNVDIVLSDGYKFIDQSTIFEDVYSKKEKNEIINNLDNIFHTNVSKNTTVNVALLIKKKVLLENPYDISIQTEDWDMNLKLAYSGYKFGFVDKKLFYYRIVSNSLSRNLEVMKDSYIKVTSKYINYIQSDAKLYKNYKLNLINFDINILKYSKTKKDKKELFDLKKNKIILKYKKLIKYLKLINLYITNIIDIFW